MCCANEMKFKPLTKIPRQTSPVSADSRTTLERLNDQALSQVPGSQSNNLSVPQQHEQQNGVVDPQSLPTTGSTMNPVQNFIPPRRSTAASPQAPRKHSFKKALSLLSDLKSLISLVLVYGITVGMISTSSSADAPVAKAGVTSGFLVLNILALANTYTFLAASDKVWERLQWGDLLRGGENMATFLALNSSTGLAGWTRMLLRKRKYTSGGHPRLWSFGRYVTYQNPYLSWFPCNCKLRISCWMLIQFPGLIFLSKFR